MRYMLLIYTKEDEAARRSSEEMQQIMNAHRALMEETRSKGILENAEPLATTETATTVRMQNGKALVTDGPFAETREQLAGYYILNCKDLDEAIMYASKIPTACGGLSGSVEIRPFRSELAQQKSPAVKASASVNG
jgi:hypothetical protein